MHLESWEERLKSPPRSTSSFAEDELRAWCALAGLPAEHATRIVQDFAARELETGLTVLELERMAANPAKSAPQALGATLAYYRSDDDCPQLRFFPAAWPRRPGVSDKEQWAVVSSGGISGLRLHLAVDGPAPVLVERVHVRALSFYNGQVTSLTSIAEHIWTAPVPGPASPPSLSLEMPGFVIPAADPQSRRQVILILVVQTTLPEDGEATLTPSIETMSGIRPSPALPPLRLRALRPSWNPWVSRSDIADARRDERVLRLNIPSAWSGTSILPADRGNARDRARALVEGWLAQVSPEATTMVVVHTKKHISSQLQHFEVDTELRLSSISLATDSGRGCLTMRSTIRRSP